MRDNLHGRQPTLARSNVGDDGLEPLGHDEKMCEGEEGVVGRGREVL